MSFNTFRPFAIYLAIFLIISESPGSAFTVLRAKTTTLKSSYDLTGEESAILEVKYDLPKLNNDKETKEFKHNDKITTVVPPTNTNILNGETKVTSSGKTKIPSSSNQPTTILTQTSLVDNAVENQESKKNEHTSQTAVFTNGIVELKEVSTEQTLILSTENIRTISTVSFPESVTNLSPISAESITTSGLNDFVTLYPSRNTSGVDIKNKNNLREHRYPHVTTDLESAKTEITSNATEHTTSSSENFKETFFPGTLAPEASLELSITTDLAKKDTTFIIPVSKLNTSANTQLGDDMKYTLKSSDAVLSTISNFATTNLLDSTEKENAVTNTNSMTETLIGEASSIHTKVTWKAYTTIDRKRVATTTELESSTTDNIEELARAETVNSKVTVEKAITDMSTPSLKELGNDLLNNSVVQTTNDIGTEKISVIETLPFITGQNLTEQDTSTLPTNLETPLTDYVSKRAGFLDLSAIQNGKDEPTTTENELQVALNETELIRSMFEFDAPDAEVAENKNSSISESQSQLAEDAIKEELLKEQVLNDHVPKGYGDRVKPTDDSNLDDLLSVKPIGTGKGNLYTVSPNYKPMKKIEVQPLKPFVRDPDDNSWRNESLSSLGIVFNAKNASKPFTQVLKNKTEAQLNNISEKDEKNEVPDLRVRLEKITEGRKSRKKKINKFGETVYTDYEDGTSSEVAKMLSGSLPMYDSHVDLLLSGKRPTTTQRPSTSGVYMNSETTTTTKKPLKHKHKHAEYYDTTDEYDDYTLPKIDLKKFTTQMYAKPTFTTPAPKAGLTKHVDRPINHYLPDRKPTVQYFPPRTSTRPQKVNVNDYDIDFEKKVNMFTYTEIPKGPIVAPSLATVPTTNGAALPVTTDYSRQHKPANLVKNLYATFPSQPVDYNNRQPANNDESFNRASYVIKHFKDLIDVAVKEDYERGIEYMPPFTEAPLTGVTMTKDKVKSNIDDDYDYETNFRKDIMNKFVDNFNQNSERFKVDFQILYNNSVMHSQFNGKFGASSSTFLKRLYGEPPRGPLGRLCDRNCDVKVELSPAYELHYYVPDQEEKEVADSKPVPLPYNYRL